MAQDVLDQLIDYCRKECKYFPSYFFIKNIVKGVIENKIYPCLIYVPLVEGTTRFCGNREYVLELVKKCPLIESEKISIKAEYDYNSRGLCIVYPDNFIEELSKELSNDAKSTRIQIRIQNTPEYILEKYHRLMCNVHDLEDFINRYKKLEPLIIIESREKISIEVKLSYGNKNGNKIHTASITDLKWDDLREPIAITIYGSKIYIFKYENNEFKKIKEEEVLQNGNNIFHGYIPALDPKNVEKKEIEKPIIIYMPWKPPVYFIPQEFEGLTIKGYSNNGVLKYNYRQKNDLELEISLK